VAARLSKKKLPRYSLEFKLGAVRLTMRARPEWRAGSDPLRVADGQEGAQAVRLEVSDAMRHGQSARCVCMRCKAVDRVATVTRGSPALELALWLLVVPGVIYSTWRLRGRVKVCALCGSYDVLPDDAPLVLQTFPDLALPRTKKPAVQMIRDVLVWLTLGAGVSVVLAFAVATAFPQARASNWLWALVVVAATLIAAHPIMGALHLFLHFLRSRRRPEA
jgi:hypothetical protein